MKYAIEKDFPFEEVDPIAEAESYRKEINRPIYHIHKWWAKRLGSVFRAVVSGALSEGSWRGFHKLQDFSGKVVLDPFMGSGTTLGEAAKLGAHVVGCDANPVSTFMVRQALTRVNPVDLETEFRSIERDVRDRILSYHTTMIPGEETPARALYHFWVKTVTTPGGEEIPLFPSYVFARNSNPGKKPGARIICPECRAVFSDAYDAQSATCPECSRRFDPRDGRRRRGGRDGRARPVLRGQAVGAGQGTRRRGPFRDSLLPGPDRRLKQEAFRRRDRAAPPSRFLGTRGNGTPEERNERRARKVLPPHRAAGGRKEKRRRAAALKRTRQNVSASPDDGNSLSEPPVRTRDLLDRHHLGQVSRLVHVCAENVRHVVG